VKTRTGYPLAKCNSAAKPAFNEIAGLAAPIGAEVYPNDVVGVSDFTTYQGFVQSRVDAQRCWYQGGLWLLLERRKTGLRINHIFIRHERFFLDSGGLSENPQNQKESPPL
jgi:hypothetical protein